MTGAYLALLLAGATPLDSHFTPSHETVVDGMALEAATRELCDKEVALLGEAAHGDARTELFKAALMENLVRRCGYRAVFFESSFYEFVPIARARRNGDPITPTMVATAIGGLWKFDREFQSVPQFLAEQANAGTVSLGGLDFQLGGLDQNYTNEGVVSELAATLEPEQAEGCRSVAQERLNGGLSLARRADAARCLAAMADHLPAGSRAENGERRMMLSNLGTALNTDPGNGISSYISARDRAMFDNFERMRRRLPRGTKIIVWAANAHISNWAGEDPNFTGIRNFGSYIKQRYRRRAFALGFSALSGSQRWGREPRPLPAAPPESLEARTMVHASNDTLFLGRDALRSMGAIEAAPFGHIYHPGRWWERFDAMVVFREERAAERIRD
ncbi:MAG: erythromycin esterase family protein [Sphingopyxis sp.]